MRVLAGPGDHHPLVQRSHPRPGLLSYIIPKCRHRYDVVFYTPWIGWILSRSASMPPGGAETQILMLAKCLARRGLRVAIIAYDSASDVPDEFEGVTIVPRPAYNTNRRLIGKFIETFQIWRSLSAAPSPVVVYRCGGVTVGLIAVYAKLFRRRLVFTSANISDFDRTAWRQVLPNRRDTIIYSLGARLADVIVVQTEEQIPLCESTFGRTPTLIKSLEPVGEPQSAAPEAFLWVGRLVSYKQPLAYLELARALPQAKFWMVGVPVSHLKDDEEVARKVVERAKAIPNLQLLPPCRHDDLQSLMGRAVASVNTADFEGMPNVLLEGWTQGVPALVLTHDPGGVVTRFGLGGFANGSAEAFTDLAREQWRHRGNRRELSERCRAYVAEYHSPAKVAAQWHAALLGTSEEAPDASLARAESTCAA